MRWIYLLLAFLVCTDGAADPTKPHFHSGVLPPYDGQPIKMSELTADQKKILDKGKPLVSKEMVGKFGRGIVIQDINAKPAVCMSKIRDLANYTKMVPHLKVCDVYDTQTFTNGTTKTKAKFVLGLYGASMGYYVHTTHEPKFDTVTWTLDYSRLSTLDDSVGHWQVMQHPVKSDWSRVLYSTQAKLMPWVPGIIVNYISKKALTEATGWLKREAELEQTRLNTLGPSSPAPEVTQTTDGVVKTCSNPQCDCRPACKCAPECKCTTGSTPEKKSTSSWFKGGRKFAGGWSRVSSVVGK